MNDLYFGTYVTPDGLKIRVYRELLNTKYITIGGNMGYAETGERLITEAGQNVMPTDPTAEIIRVAGVSTPLIKVQP